MESATHDQGELQPIRWYMRSDVDEYLEEMQRRRLWLETIIADATERTERARATVGLQRIMANMVVDAQRDINQRRRDAETSARAVITAGEHEAAALIAEATAAVAAPPADDRTAIGDTSLRATPFDRTPLDDLGEGDVISLVTESPGADLPPLAYAPDPVPVPEPQPQSAAAPPVSEAPFVMPNYRTAGLVGGDEGDDEFFEYLRGSFGEAGPPGPLAE